ncbi:hypothetical protein B0T14DRAFT_462229, partial [Immersiella caudata]
TGSNGEFCTTDELYLTGGIGPFSYIGCGGGPTTDRYSAFTVDAASTATSSSVKPTSSQTSSTAPPTTVSQAPGPIVNSTTSPPSSLAPTAGSEGAAASPNNTGVIIGGVIGCVALLCGSGIVVVWLLRIQRNRNNQGSRQPSRAQTGHLQDTASNVDRKESIKTTWVISELDGQIADSWGPKGPAELPASWTPRVARAQQ